MPDDSATQKAHAERIKTERTVMDMTGLSRSQVRHLQGELTNFAKKQIEARPPAITNGGVVGPTIARSDVVLGGHGIAAPARQGEQIAPALNATLQVIAAMGVRADNSDEFVAHEVIFYAVSDQPLE